MARASANTASVHTASSSYEATLRVPLILFAPSVVPPAVVDSLAGHDDIVPTILDCDRARRLRGSAPAQLLSRAVGAPAPATPLYFEALSAAPTVAWAPLTAVLRARRQYVELPLPELYDLAGDPGEQSQSRRVTLCSGPAPASGLAWIPSGLRFHSQKSRAARDRETREALRALGYLSSAAAPLHKRYGAEDDPKRGWWGLDTLMEQVLARTARAIWKGRWPSAATSFARGPTCPPPGSRWPSCSATRGRP